MSKEPGMKQDLEVGTGKEPEQQELSVAEVDAIRIAAQLFLDGDKDLVAPYNQAVNIMRLCAEIERLREQNIDFQLYISFYQGTIRGLQDRYGDKRIIPEPPNLPPLPSKPS